MYVRRARGVVLIAPGSGEPFATAPFSVGRSVSRGASIEAAWSRPRYTVVGRYGLQRVELSDGTTTYVPDHGARHILDGGITLLPSMTSSIRVGVTAALGRRATTFDGGLEWESCNLADRGCEFAGSPHYSGQQLGATALPAYVRADISVRKEWRVTLRGRPVHGALFGTLTNVFNRRNVLTYTKDPATQGVVPLEMRPLAPLVVGLDWRF
jgi:hypothetical protein